MPATGSMVRLVAACLGGVLCLMPGATLAQGNGAGVGAAGGPGYTALEPLQSGETIADIAIDFVGGDAPPELAQAVRETLGLRSGDRWDPVVGQARLSAIRSLRGVRDARFSRGRIVAGGRQIFVVVDLEAAETPAPSAGLLATGDIADFPVLYRDDRAYIRIDLSGGFGAFSDGNPWFGSPQVFTRGNPLVEDPTVGADTGDRASWTEGFVQAGLGGVAPLDDDGLYAFGAASVIAPGSIGQDIFRDNARASFDVEKLYAGLLYAPEGQDLRLKASVGRQNYTLNNGFLVSQFGSQSNAGPRPGVYLAPRTTHDFSVLASARFAGWSAQGFFLDPNEYEPIESNTQLAGLNLRHEIDERHAFDATVLHVPQSDTLYRAPDSVARGREGLWTIAGHFRQRAPQDAPGVWFETELAYQRHEDFDMSAWAGYGEVGYIARTTRWTPSASYRLAHFSGDDPDTGTYERFDTLFSGGLDHWLQGISINKLLTQSNRTTHRLRFNVTPDPTLNLTLDLYHHVADELNNLGANPALGTLSSRELGQEVQVVARWTVSPDVFVLGIAGVAFPGEAIEAATPGPDEPWTTLQAQLFWAF